MEGKTLLQDAEGHTQQYQGNDICYEGGHQHELTVSGRDDPPLFEDRHHDAERGGAEDEPHDKGAAHEPDFPQTKGDGKGPDQGQDKAKNRQKQRRAPKGFSFF